MVHTHGNTVRPSLINFKSQTGFFQDPALAAVLFLFLKEIVDGDVNENDKRSRGLSQDDDEEDDEDEDIPGKTNLLLFYALCSC